MGIPSDLEALRSVFKDHSLHIAVGKILRNSMVKDRSSLRCFVSIWPEEREIVATMAWNAVGPNAGLFQFPVPGDLVIVAFADADPDQAFIMSRLSSKEDTIPETAADGSTVIRSLEEKMLWLTSGTKINLSKGDTPPTENLVLGQELKNLLIEILAKLSDLSLKTSTHTHIGNLGYPTSAPNEAADFVQLKGDFEDLSASPVEDEVILSDLAFTEKG